MKNKLLSLVFAVFFSGMMSAQVLQYSLALDNSNATSGNSRAPQGTQRYARTIYIITATEMASSGLVTGNTLNALGFNYLTAQNVATTGNFKVYLQNTADVTNTKSTSWATAISGMTLASNSTFTIPAAIGQANHVFAGGSSFTYTGGSIYVAFEYANATGAIATTANVAACNNTLVDGLKSAQSTSALPTTIGVSNFRPQTFLATLVACATPTNLDLTNVTQTTATLTWTAAAGSPASYDVEYGPFGFTQGTGTIANVIGTSYTFPAQAIGSNFSFYLRSNCGTSQSAWLGAFNVFLAKSPPYSNNFDVANNRSDGFVGEGNWAVAIDSPAITVSQTPTAFYYSNNSPAPPPPAVPVNSNSQLYSRPFNLVAGATNTATFYTRLYAFDNTTVTPSIPGIPSPMTLNVFVNTTRSLTGATPIGTAITTNGITHVIRTVPFTVPTTGNYYIIFSNTTPAAIGATNTTALIFDTFAITSTALSVNDIVKNDSNFIIYPNPVSEILNIRSEDKVKGVEIYDLSGRKVSVELTGNTVNVKELRSGTYIISVETTKGKSTEKFIKK